MIIIAILILLLAGITHLNIIMNEKDKNKGE